MRSILSLILLVVSISLAAQEFPSENWYVGRVTLTNGVEKEGVIKYDLESNSIQLSVDNKIETYHASQFYTFTILMKNVRRSYTHSLMVAEQKLILD